MSFLYPFFLFLLPLAALPLILFTGLRGKKKEIIFSTLFLIRREEFRDERFKQRLRLWLIIILRILMIITIIFLLARPRYFGKRWHFAYFDASISMKEAKAERARSALFKLLDIFGEKRVFVIDFDGERLFIKDTSEVPPMAVNDVFYTDGRLPFQPSGKVICAPLSSSDAWIHLDSIKGGYMYFSAFSPENTVVKVYNLLQSLDSFEIKAGKGSFIYSVSGRKMNYPWFFVDYRDNLMENNYFFYVALNGKIPVRLDKKLMVLKAFFDSYPFTLSPVSDNCVSVDTILQGCKRQVVFFSKKNRGLESYVNKAHKVPFGKWYGYMMHSGINSFLFFRFYPHDTAAQFYDPEFLKALSDTLKNMFKEERAEKNVFIRDVDFSICRGPLVPEKNSVAGFYVCNGDTVAVNIDIQEYRKPSLCKHSEEVSFKQLSSIMVFQRLLVYFLILLFVFETALLYFL